MPSPRRAVFLDHQSLDLGDLDLSPLKQQFDEFELFAATRPDQVAERLQGAVAVVSNKVMLDAPSLAANPQLKLILVAATGCGRARGRGRQGCCGRLAWALAPFKGGDQCLTIDGPPPAGA